jgi:hypothetical protein
MYDVHDDVDVDDDVYDVGDDVYWRFVKDSFIELGKHF